MQSPSPPKSSASLDKMSNPGSQTVTNVDNPAVKKPSDPNVKKAEVGSPDPKKKSKMPLGVFFILGNEFCERFSYYGIRSLAVLYFTSELSYKENKAKEIYHAFVAVAYFTPILGAIIADSFLGKFWTIFLISLVYAAGNLTLSIGSALVDKQTMDRVSVIGLFTIALGTGGIKPCVSAFGGDQFGKDDNKARHTFFSVFYFVINAGSVISTFVSPILKGDIPCMGKENCYPLAFGIPALLFAVALIVFIGGKALYKLVPPSGSAIISVVGCIFHALVRRCRIRDREHREHWLQYADDTYDEQTIRNVRILLGVLWLYIPLPLFWALFEQHGSTWVLQASKMDGEFRGTYIKAEHMLLLNPILILILIPVFDYIIYPILGLMRMCKKPLQRITCGGLLTAVAFILVGFIQIKIEAEQPVPPPSGYSEMIVINNSPCNIHITSSGKEKAFPMELEGHGRMEISNRPTGIEMTWQFTPSGCSVSEMVEKKVTSYSPYEVAVIHVDNDKLDVHFRNDSRRKTSSSQPRMRVFFILNHKFPKDNSSSFLLTGDRGTLYVFPDNLTESTQAGSSEYCEFKAGNYKVFLPAGNKSHENNPIGEAKFKQGGNYLVVVYQDKNDTKSASFSFFSTVEENGVPILAQVLPALIITAGEVMLSVTGLDLAYSEAPESMKSLVQAGWLMTNAVGNLLVLIVLKSVKFDKQSHEFFMYAGLMGMAMVVFAIMAHFYTYVEDQDKDLKKKEAEAAEKSASGQNLAKPGPEPPVQAPEATPKSPEAASKA